ncbi:MAG: prepilin-type N-terminal cleavage/methylation domain-containing protein [Planctomycetota bacterium]
MNNKCFSPGGLPKHRGRGRGFTLIEVLVVVAIIALLAAILIPSLRQARVQANIAVCKANCKQIGTIVATYRSEHKTHVPIMFNYYSNGDPNHKTNTTGHHTPAKATWLSVALRSYDKGTRNLKNIPSTRVPGEYFDPEQIWGYRNGSHETIKLRDEYEDRIMPDHYACPFERHSGEGSGDVINEVGGIGYQELTGRLESYHTWLWEIIEKGTSVWGENSPLVNKYTGFGIAKHTAITWNQIEQRDRELPDGKRWDTEDATNWKNPFFHEYHRRWKRRWSNIQEREVKVLNLSDVTVSWCAQGEHLAFAPAGIKYLRYNVDSHRTSRGGGCNAIFGDTHVEWVKGTQIGWR